MADPCPKLTPKLQKDIVSFIVAGGSPHDAAEAAGLPRDVFDHWMRRGERSTERGRYRAFTRAVREAEGKARLNAQTKVSADKPLDWLKVMGKDGDVKTGRSPRRAETKTSKLEAGQLLGEIFDLFGRCAEQLAPYPEARAALAAWLIQLPLPEEK